MTANRTSATTDAAAARIRLGAIVITTATLVIAYLLSGRNLRLVLDSVAATIVVLIVLFAAYGYYKLVKHTHNGFMKVLLHLTTAFIAVIVTVLVLRTNIGLHVWHWFAHLSTWRGWVTALVLIAGYWIAWRPQMPRRRQQVVTTSPSVLSDL